MNHDSLCMAALLAIGEHEEQAPRRRPVRGEQPGHLHGHRHATRIVEGTVVDATLLGHAEVIPVGHHHDGLVGALRIAAGHQTHEVETVVGVVGHHRPALVEHVEAVDRLRGVGVDVVAVQACRLQTRVLHPAQHVFEGEVMADRPAQSAGESVIGEAIDHALHACRIEGRHDVSGEADLGGGVDGRGVALTGDQDQKCRQDGAHP